MREGRIASRRRDAAESVGRLALAEVPPDAVVVLVHDAARPFVDDGCHRARLEALDEGWDGAVPGLPVADTVKRVEGDRVVETLARDLLATVQTPQAFLADVLERRPRARAATARRSSRRWAVACGSCRAIRGC